MTVLRVRRPEAEHRPYLTGSPPGFGAAGIIDGVVLGTAAVRKLGARLLRPILLPVGLVVGALLAGAAVGGTLGVGIATGLVSALAGAAVSLVGIRLAVLAALGAPDGVVRRYQTECAAV